MTVFNKWYGLLNTLHKYSNYFIHRIKFNKLTQQQQINSFIPIRGIGLISTTRPKRFQDTTFDMVFNAVGRKNLQLAESGINLNDFSCLRIASCMFFRSRMSISI